MGLDVKNIFLFGPIIYGLLLLGLITRTGEPLALMIPFLVYIGVGLLSGPGSLAIKVKRTLSEDRVMHGALIKVSVTVFNNGSRLEEVFLEEQTPSPFEIIHGVTNLLTSLEPGESTTWEYTIKAVRGYYRFEGIKVDARDHFHLFPLQEFCEAEARVTVLPSAIKLKQIPIKPRRTRVYSGLIPARSGGQGIEFLGVREYQEGDSTRLINWKATARHSQAYFSNEFEQERVADVGIILDARLRCYMTYNDESLFEYSVSAASALSDVFLTGGNRVGMFIYGRVIDWTFPGYGKIQKEKILHALARAKPGTHMVFDKLENLPARLFPSHSQLVFISPLLRDDLYTLTMLRARGYQVFVVSPDPIGHGLISKDTSVPDPDAVMGYRIAVLERKLLINQIIKTGVQVLDWQVETPLQYAVNSALYRQHLTRN
jgi:uncharacterized protein (DUF58 family)